MLSARKGVRSHAPCKHRASRQHSSIEGAAIANRLEQVMSDLSEAQPRTTLSTGISLQKVSAGLSPRQAALKRRYKTIVGSFPKLCQAKKGLDVYALSRGEEEIFFIDPNYTPLGPLVLGKSKVAITSLLREATESREGMVPNQGKEEDPDFEVADEDPNEQPCYEPAPFVEPDTYILLKDLYKEGSDGFDNSGSDREDQATFEQKTRKTYAQATPALQKKDALKQSSQPKVGSKKYLEKQVQELKRKQRASDCDAELRDDIIRSFQRGVTAQDSGQKKKIKSLGLTVKAMSLSDGIDEKASEDTQNVWDATDASNSSAAEHVSTHRAVQGRSGMLKRNAEDHIASTTLPTKKARHERIPQL